MARLALVDTDTGEAFGRVSAQHRTREELLEINEGLKGKLDGYLLQISNLQRQLSDHQGEAPDAEDVRLVGEYWGRRVEEEGWWSRPPLVKPGGARWTNIKARLKDHQTYDCYLAVEGAVLQDRKQTKREWVDIASLFRNEENFDRAFERAKDPMLERVRANLLSLPAHTSRRAVEEQLEPCELCGHSRFDHHRQLMHPTDTIAHLDPCGWNDCGCPFYGEGFKRFGRRAAA